MSNATFNDAPDILSRFEDLRILVIGDVMLDHYTWGDVTRISPEAPVPVVQVRKETFTAGGAANVALNLSSLGVKTCLLSIWGRDESGNRLASLLCQKGIGFEHSVQHDSVQTIVKKRIVVRTQQLCRVDYEGPHSMYRIPTNDANHLIEDATDGCSAIVVSDYAKGFLHQDLLDHLQVVAKERGISIAVDPKPARALNYSSPRIITPNRSEALQMAGLNESVFGEPFPTEEACRVIREKFDPTLLVITLGADGMIVSEKGKKPFALPTVAREVFDVSGAGDTVIATLTAATLAGADSLTAAKIANAAAGCVVGHIGTVPVDLEELKERLNFPSVSNE